MFVASFLGMSNSGDNSDFNTISNITIDIAKVLDSVLFQNIGELKSRIEDSISSLNSITINFLVTDRIYNEKVSANFQKLFGLTSLEDCHSSELGKSFREFASTRYWQARSRQPVSIPFKQDRIRLLVHIRRGDRVWVELPDKTLLMHGDELLIVDNSVKYSENNYILSSLSSSLPNKFRKPVSVDVIKEVIEQLFIEYGRSAFSMIVISDGYKRAYQELNYALRSGKIKLSQSEKKQVNLFFQQQQKEIIDFAKSVNAELILGEDSKVKFMKSVHAVVCADFIIKTTGGFTSLNRLLRVQDSPSVFLGTSDLTPQTLEVFLTEARHFRKPYGS
ncbi:hypothetical protein [Nostoc piscinale]|uniref:hypothetical protein n=1 Tax=Nostoc piscinale TaxID=224012 RepID=UPI0011873BC1|nr:hypothetical protein [Nostoc piscinale]